MVETNVLSCPAQIHMPQHFLHLPRKKISSLIEELLSKVLEFSSEIPDGVESQTPKGIHKNKQRPYCHSSLKP